MHRYILIFNLLFIIVSVFQGCEKQYDNQISNLDGEILITLNYQKDIAIDEDFNVNLYPHPFSSNLNIVTRGDFASGIMNKPEKDGTIRQYLIGNTQLRLDFSGYREGFYYLEIKLDANIFRFRILKL